MNTADRLRDYLATRKVFVIDTTTASRLRLVQVMRELGAQDDSIWAVRTYSEALDLFATEKPDVVIADNHLGAYTGMELIADYLKILPASSDEQRIFALLTAGGSHVSVARACELNIDCFIVKPYTVPRLKALLTEGFSKKMIPTKYQLKVREGRALFEAGQISEAVKVFEEAINLDALPSVACYYLGQCALKNGTQESAESDFEHALKVNRVHYRSLCSLQSLISKQGRTEELYRLLQRISHYFPGHPDRLKQRIGLAIGTRHFEDLEACYKEYFALDRSTSDVDRHICAGLVITAIHALQQGDIEAGIHALNRVAAIAQGQLSFLLKIVEVLVDAGLKDPATEALAHFNPTQQSSEEFQVAKVLCLALNGEDDDALQLGEALIVQGYRHASLEIALMEIYRRKNQVEKAKTYLSQACRRWPNDPLIASLSRRLE